MKYDVFISHSSKDCLIAQELCDYLEKNNIKCWIAPRDVTAGIPYAQAILKGIDECQVMVLVFSADANKSRHIESEIDRAFNKEKVIIPFRISDVIMSDVLSYYIGKNHYIDGIPEPTSAFEKLKNQIERNLPCRQKQMDIDELLIKLAELKGLSVDELKNAIESLRTSDDQCFEDLLESFIKIEQEVGAKKKGCLSNEIGEKGAYSILQNAKGEIMIMMSAREGEPENPRFIYDGGDAALLYRNTDSSVSFRHIDENAHDVLKNLKEILIVEIANDDVEREYTAPVRLVKNVEALIL